MYMYFEVYLDQGEPFWGGGPFFVTGLHDTLLLTETSKNTPGTKDFVQTINIA